MGSRSMCVIPSVSGDLDWPMIASPLVVTTAIASVWYAWMGPFDEGTWYVLCTAFVFAGLMTTHLWLGR